MREGFGGFSGSACCKSAESRIRPSSNDPPRSASRTCRGTGWIFAPLVSAETFRFNSVRRQGRASKAMKAFRPASVQHDATEPAKLSASQAPILGATRSRRAVLACNCARGHCGDPPADGHSEAGSRVILLKDVTPAAGSATRLRCEASKGDIRRRSPGAAEENPWPPPSDLDPRLPLRDLR